MKTWKQSLLASLLIFALFLSGCRITTFSQRVEHLQTLLEPATGPSHQGEKPDSGKPDSGKPDSGRPTQGKPDPETPDSPSVQAPISHEYNTYVPYQDFEREYEPYLEQIPFSEMEYIPPQAEPVQEGYASVQTLVEQGSADAEEIVAAFEEVYEEHLFFNTMHSLSYIRYSLNLNDSYYDEEYNRCEELSPLLNQAQEKCYVAMSESPLREELEEAYFGEDFFLFYDQHRVYSEDSVVRLMQEESAIESEYLALQNDPTIVWKGTETSVDDLLADSSLPYQEYLQVYRAYYDKYAPLSAELYARLIRVRKEIAGELNYDSYADFAYSYLYERDYTAAQVADYCDEIAEELPSLLLTAIMAQAELPGKDVEESLSLFRDTVESFGGVLKTAYEFMEDYGLWDTTISSAKLPGSYMTYLNSYEMPFLYVSPNETLGDLLTLCHEFGHFTDGFVNCGGFTSIDCAEVFSQSLEYLALNRADLNPDERTTLERSKAADSVMVFLTQACYAEFEALAYELPEDKLTAQGLNDLFMECNRKYGISNLYMGMEDLLAPGWVDVQHFFIAPFYVISYCVSNDTALQVYQRELASGDGLQLYYELLCQPTESSLLELTEAAGLDSPFTEGRIREIADFLEDQLD